MKDISDRDVERFATLTEQEEAATTRPLSPEERLHLAQHDAQKEVAVTGGEDLMGSPADEKPRDFERGT